MMGRATKALRGCRCQCMSCFEYFASPSAFDRHRKGSYARPGSLRDERYCLSLSAMQEAGWVRNPSGFLMAPDSRRAGAAVSDRPPSGEGDCPSHAGNALLGPPQQLHGPTTGE